MNSRVKILFEEMGLESNYTLFEEGKETDEVKAIAKKRGIKLPSKDIALFSCKYAMVNQENLNGCILPKKEVEKALPTLNSKAIDKDHYRKQTVGYWLDADLIKDEIIAYGCFWKSNFSEEYDDIKNRMKNGKVKISFEAWGNREFNKDGSYNLNDIEFAGGALLFDTDPAFPDAEVIEFSHKNRVLEFAKVLEETKKITKCEYCNTIIKAEEGNEVECSSCKQLKNSEGTVHTLKEMEEEIKKMENKMKDMSDEKEKEKMKEKIKNMKEKMKEMHGSTETIEESRLSFNWDTNTIARIMLETKCPTCDVEGWNDILNIDFESNKVKSRCPNCNGINMYDLTPSVTIVKKGKKPEPIKIAKTISENLTEKEVKELMDEFLKKYSKASVEELVKFLDSEIASIKTVLATKEQEITTKDTELTAIKAEKTGLLKAIEDSKLLVENSKLELETIKVELSGFKADKEAKIAAEKADKIKSRKEDLGEYAKDISDEDILNDLKFENAKLKKERDEAVKKVAGKGINAGAIITNEDETVKKRKEVQSRAWDNK